MTTKDGEVVSFFKSKNGLIIGLVLTGGILVLVAAGIVKTPWSKSTENSKDVTTAEVLKAVQGLRREVIETKVIARGILKTLPEPQRIKAENLIALQMDAIKAAERTNQ